MRFRRNNKNKRFGWRSRAVAGLFVVGLIAGLLITNFYKPTEASAAINYIGQSTNSISTAAGTMSITTPSGIAIGNVLVAQVIALPGTGNGVTITPPTGWSLIGTSPSANKYTMGLYYHVVASGDTTTPTWSFSPNSTATGGISAFSGVSTSNPIDTSNSQTNGSTTSHTAPSVTASYANGVVVPFWGFQSGQNASSIDASLTSIYGVNNGSNSGISSGYVQLSLAGATGTYSATTSSTTSSLAETIALQPAQAAAGVQFVGATAPTACTASCTSVSEAAPTGWKTNDLLLTNITWNGSVTLTAPSGWTLVGTAITSGTYTSANYWHFADTSVDPSSWTWSFSGSGPSSVLVSTVEFQGVDQTTSSPIDVVANKTDASSTNSHDSQPVTTTQAMDMLYTSYGITNKGSITSFTNTGTQIWNQQASNSNGVVSIFAAYELQGTAGLTSAKNATGINAIAMMQSVAIKAALPTPQLVTPVNGAHLNLLPTFKFVSATLSGSLQYKLYLCSAVNCPTGTVLNTYDQTSSQTGWSGQDANSGTAYVSTTDGNGATVATYTVQSALTPCTTYYWRVRSWDVAVNQDYNFSASRSFTTSCTPSAPTLLFPAASQTGVRFTPEFQLATTDLDNDYVQYKIDLCSNATCSVILNTATPWNQTLSQANWSGQDAQSSTAYTADASSISNSVKAYYAPASPLTPGTTYYWRAYAIDPGGTNTWSSASAIQSFTIGTTETRILNGSIQSGRIL